MRQTKCKKLNLRYCGFLVELDAEIVTNTSPNWCEPDGFDTERHGQSRTVKHHDELTMKDFKRRDDSADTHEHMVGSGMADEVLQLITGHARRETLAIYQHVALDVDLEEKYQEAMKKPFFESEPDAILI